jgi:hypothetical protein
MIRFLRGLARITARLVLGTMLGAFGLILTGLAPVLALGALLVLLAQILGPSVAPSPVVLAGSLHGARHGRAGSMRTTLIPRGPGIGGQLHSICTVGRSDT